MVRKALRNVFVLALVIILLATTWVSFELFVPHDLPSERVFHEIEKGESLKAIAQDLQKKGVIRSSLSFLIGYRFFFFPEKIRAGEYAFSSPATLKNVLEALTKGKVFLHSLTIPEGLTAQEMVPIIVTLSSDREEDFWTAFRNAEAIFALDQKAKNLEGYLFPETYYFPKGVSAEEILQSMVTQFKTVFAKLWPKRSKEMTMSVRETVTLASLIEKETSLSTEKRLVSAVFHNRLKSGMKLDCDPTIIYSLKQKAGFEGRLRSADLKLDSPYNTYLYAGLPPGPICNPGRESLEAALFPAAENYLYFVSRNDGSHHFSRTHEEHLAAVRKYQKHRPL